MGSKFRAFAHDTSILHVFWRVDHDGTLCLMRGPIHPPLRRPKGTPAGGQFSPKGKAKNVTARSLSLNNPMPTQNTYPCMTYNCKRIAELTSAWCARHDPYPDDFSCGIIEWDRPLVLERSPEDNHSTSKWVDKDATLRMRLKFNQASPFENTKENIQDYCAAIVVDMLNAGDIPPSRDYINFAAWGVLQALRHSIGERKWNHPMKELDIHQHMHMVIGMAAAKTLNVIGANQFTQQGIPRSWHPDMYVSSSRIFSEEMYQGEDGQLLDRYIDIPFDVGGPTLFDEDPPSHEREANLPPAERHPSLWLAAYLLGEREQTHPSYKKAKEVLERTHSEDLNYVMSFLLSEALKAQIYSDTPVASIKSLLAMSSDMDIDMHIWMDVLSDWRLQPDNKAVHNTIEKLKSKAIRLRRTVGEF